MRRLIYFLLIGIFLFSFTSAGINYKPATDIDITFSNKNYSIITTTPTYSFDADFIVSIDGVEYDSKNSLNEYKKYNSNAKVNKIKKEIKKTSKRNELEWGWTFENVDGINFDYGDVVFNNFSNLTEGDFKINPIYSELETVGDKTYKNYSDIVNYEVVVKDDISIAMKSEANWDCDVEYLGNLKFRYYGNMTYCLDPVVLSGSKYVITGYKLDTTISSAGTWSGGGQAGSYVNFSSDLFEDNIVATGTAGTGGNDCNYHDGAGTRDANEDSTASFSDTITSGLIEHNINESLWGATWGYYTDTAYRSNLFDNYGCNDNYEIFGFNLNPSNYSKVMDSNLLVVMNGSGAGQVKAVKITMNNTLVLYGNWETIPSAGDRIVILWSPADIVYSDSNAGNISTTDKGRRITNVDIIENTNIGDGSIETGYGWAGYQISLTNTNGEGTGWLQYHRRYSNSNIYVGEWNPISQSQAGLSGYMNNYQAEGWSGGGFLAEYSTTDQDAYIYGSCEGAGTSYTGYNSITESHSTTGEPGSELSINDIGFANAYNTENSYFEYRGGNWGEPFGQLRSPEFNTNVRGTIGKFIGSTSGRGFGWIWSNSGDPGSYWMRFIDADIDVDEYAKAGGFDPHSAFFWLDAYADTFQDETMYWTKSFNRPILDSDGNPIEGAVVNISNSWGETVSYSDSGARINEAVDDSETSIDIINCHNLTNATVYLIDREFINFSNVPSGTAPYNCTATAVREAIHSNGYYASEHNVEGTVGYDATIWKIGTITSNENGTYEEQLIDIGYWNYQPSQVYHNGVFYEAKADHIANSTYEPGVGADWATYWNSGVGTEKIQWRDGARYHKELILGSFSSKAGMKNLNPITVTVTANEYFKNTETFTIGMDSRGYTAPIVLYKWYEIEGVTKFAWNKITNVARFWSK